MPGGRVNGSVSVHGQGHSSCLFFGILVGVLKDALLEGWRNRWLAKGRNLLGHCFSAVTRRWPAKLQTSTVFWYGGTRKE